MRRLATFKRTLVIEYDPALGETAEGELEGHLENDSSWDQTGAYEKVDDESADPAVVAHERLDRALEAGSDAFWAAIAERFPEVTTGDFGPEETDAWERACRQAVMTWLMWNLSHGEIKVGAEVVLLDSGATGRIVDDYHDGPVHQCMVRVDPFQGEAWTQVEDLGLAEMGSPRQQLWWLWQPESRAGESRGERH